MKHPVLLNIEKQFPDAPKKKGAPANCLYRIPYAVKEYWQNENFRIVEQDYDGKDAYLSLIEIKNKEKLSFIINTHTTDLYWFYQLKGAIEIKQHPERSTPDEFIDQLHEDEYALFYSPPREYRVSFKPGHHLFFYFVVDASWLQRHPTLEPTHYQKLIKLLQHKTNDYHSTKVLKIHSAIRAEILRLFTMPNFEEMEMDAEVYSPIARLITISREDLKDIGKSLDQHTIEKLAHIRNYIKKQILAGSPPLIPDIAQHFKTNYRQLRLEHKNIYGDSLQNYITRKRLEEGARLLLETDDSITTIANTLGYDLKVFQKQLKYYYNLSPSQYRKLHKK